MTNINADMIPTVDWADGWTTHRLGEDGLLTDRYDIVRRWSATAELPGLAATYRVHYDHDAGYGAAVIVCRPDGPTTAPVRVREVTGLLLPDLIVSLALHLRAEMLAA